VPFLCIMDMNFEGICNAVSIRTFIQEPQFFSRWIKQKTYFFTICKRNHGFRDYLFSSHHQWIALSRKVSKRKACGTIRSPYAPVFFSVVDTFEDEKFVISSLCYICRHKLNEELRNFCRIIWKKLVLSVIYSKKRHKMMKFYGRLRMCTSAVNDIHWIDKWIQTRVEH
jgi:hypothetical protein